MEDVFIIHTRQHLKLTPQARFQAAPPHWSLSIPPGPSAAAGARHSVAAFLLPRGLAEKCEKMLWLRRKFFRKISSATTQHRGQAL